MKLDLLQLRLLDQALYSAFPDLKDLKRLAFLHLGDTLDGIVGPGSTRDVVAGLIQWAVSHSREQDLVTAAVRENGSNALLKAFAAQLSVTGAAPAAGELERFVLAGVGFGDVARWREEMERCERAVCRVTTGPVSGTGFLVGPDLLVTNFHVVADLLSGRAAADDLAARFDYKRPPGAPAGVVPDEGRLWRLAPGKAWRVAESPVGELDYALLRLRERPGDEPTRGGGGEPGGGPRRGWLTPVAGRFNPGDPFFIIQHPRGEPMQIGAGSVTDSRREANRVLYSTNTLEGSSGSPVFTMAWALVALHHAAADEGNQGVLFESILQDWTRRGVAVPPAPGARAPAAGKPGPEPARKPGPVRGRSGRGRKTGGAGATGRGARRKGKS